MKKSRLELITYKLFLPIIFLVSVTCIVKNSSAEIVIDYLSDAGKISNYIMGTTDAPFYDEGSYRFLKEAGFKIVEVMIWISRPPRPPFEDHRILLQEERKELDDILESNIETAKKQIRSIIQIGAEPLIFMITSKKPSDLDRYSEEVKKIVKELRSVAMESGKDLSILRFGNEPEVKHFWEGSRKDYFETYKVWVGAVKSISPNFIVEAPGFASATARYFSEEYYKEINDFTKEFLKYCEKEDVPLDIFSFHYYGTNINNISLAADAVKKELSKYPKLSPIFGVPMIAIDEWNIRVFGLIEKKYFKVFDTAHTAAHNISALINMIKSGVFISIRFGGVGFAPAQPSMMGVFDKERVDRGKKIEKIGDFLMVYWDRRPKPVYYAFKAFNEMYSTPNLLKIVVKNLPEAYAIAGCSMNEKKINIIVSLYDETSAGKAINQQEVRDALSHNASNYKAIIKNFPWDKVKDKVDIRRYIVDETNNFRLVQTKTVSKMEGVKELILSFESNVPAVNLLEVKW